MATQAPGTEMTENEIARIVVDTAFHIQQGVGSGLLGHFAEWRIVNTSRFFAPLRALERE